MEGKTAGFTTRSFGTPATQLSDLEEYARTIVPLQMDSELAEEIGDGGVAALFGNRERGLPVIGLGVKIGAMVEE